jgi:hypothetical protein
MLAQNVNRENRYGDAIWEVVQLCSPHGGQHYIT